MASQLKLPDELWLQVFRLLSWRDLNNIRCTCFHFKQLIDESRPLWRSFSVVLQDLSRYSRSFWRVLAQRQVSSVALRSGNPKDLKRLFGKLPSLEVLHLDCWKEGRIEELKRFHRLHRLSVTSCSTRLMSLEFILPLDLQLTQLSLCNVQFTCSASHLLTSITQLTRLNSLLVHHDGSLKIATLSRVLSHLTKLRFLSWTMVNYKMLSDDFFYPSNLSAGSSTLQLSDLQLLDYDAVVTPDTLSSLANLRSLSVFHLYSVPGPICHLQTWLTSMQKLQKLSVHGGHPLVAYADFLPVSHLSLTLCVDLQPEDLHVVSFRVPHLQHLHLEPWSSSSNLVRLIPQLFPHLKTLAIRHNHVSDEDFLSLQQLQHLDTLEVLDSYHRTDHWIFKKPSPRLLQLISDLQKRTNNKVRVITNSNRDSLSCNCV